MTLQGELIVRLRWDGERVDEVGIRSTRPQAARVLPGRDAHEAAGMVPLLFSICAHAQGAAASGALAAAMGGDVAEPTRASRDRAVALESLQEYLRRLLIDMPVALGLEPAVAPVAAARRAIAPLLAELAPATRSPVNRSRDRAWPEWARLLDALATVCEQAVFGMRAEAWLALPGIEGLRGWAAQRGTLPARMVNDWLREDPQLGSSDVQPMPPADRAALEALVATALAAGDAFARAPVWNGTPVETGAWPRAMRVPLVAACTEAFGNSVTTRVVARLAEIACMVVPGSLPVSRLTDAWTAADGAGIGAVHTARGLLVHRAVVTGDRVDDYAIVAPTEWNFHPQGALAQGLRRLEDRSAEALERRAAIVIQALDPCVQCTVEVARA